MAEKSNKSRLAEALIDELYGVAESGRTWLALFSNAHGSHNLQAIDVLSPDASRILYWALATDFIVGISRFTQQPRQGNYQSVCLKYALELCAPDQANFAECDAWKKAAGEIEHLTLLAKRFKVWRDTQLAHHDARVFQGAMQLPTIPKDDFEQIIIELENVTNSLCLMLDSSAVSTDRDIGRRVASEILHGVQTAKDMKTLRFCIFDNIDQDRVLEALEAYDLANSPEKSRQLINELEAKLDS